jgi:TonB family protein
LQYAIQGKKKNTLDPAVKIRETGTPTRRGSADALFNGMFATSPSLRSQREPGVFLSVAIHALVISALWHVPRVVRNGALGIQIVHAAGHETLWLPVSTIAPPSQPDVGRAENRSSVPVPARVFTDVEQPFVGSVTAPADIEASLNLVQTLDLSTDVMESRLENMPRIGINEPVVPPPAPPEKETKTADAAQPAPPRAAQVEMPRLLKKVAPVYPPSARSARVEGVVVIEATIEESGRLDHLNVVEGHPMLVDAAIEAVRQWRYIPAKLHGVPTSSAVRVNVIFNLVFPDR